MRDCSINRIREALSVNIFGVGVQLLGLRSGGHEARELQINFANSYGRLCPTINRLAFMAWGMPLRVNVRNISTSASVLSKDSIRNMIGRLREKHDFYDADVRAGNYEKIGSTTQYVLTPKFAG